MYRPQHPIHFLVSKGRQVGTSQLLYTSVCGAQGQASREVDEAGGGDGSMGDRNGWLAVEGADLGVDTQQD